VVGRGRGARLVYRTALCSGSLVYESRVPVGLCGSVQTAGDRMIGEPVPGSLYVWSRHAGRWGGPPISVELVRDGGNNVVSLIWIR
jgi:hypothetical protein